MHLWPRKAAGWLLNCSLAVLTHLACCGPQLCYTCCCLFLWKGMPGHEQSPGLNKAAAGKVLASAQEGGASCSLCADPDMPDESEYDYNEQAAMVSHSPAD